MNLPCLVLFDVDLTLVDTAGAGRAALDRAFAELFGAAGAFGEAALAGNTDRAILEDALRRHRRPSDAPTRARFFARYLELLAEELARRRARLRPLPGGAGLLDRLEAAGCRLGLLTGNVRGGAELKLAACGLAGRFAGGAFGDQDCERARLFPRALRDLGWTGEPRRVFVVGDTPADIACARENGARAIAVATGPFPAAELAVHAPDLVLDSLENAAGVLALVRGAA